jgi:hypothetical protein
MPGMDLDARTVALMLARGRVVLGVAACLVPDLIVAGAPGERRASTRALGRMMGGRDLVLGVGALTTVKEGTQDAEWVGMGAVADLVDGFTLLATRRLPRRARVIGVGALGAGVIGLIVARTLADERATAEAEVLAAQEAAARVPVA